MQVIKGALGFRNNAFVCKSPVKQCRQKMSPATSPSMDKENLQLRYVSSQGRDNSNPPLKLQLNASPNNFLTSSHKKLQSHLSNIDEKLHVMVKDHNQLRSTVQQREQEALSHQDRLQQMTEEMDEAIERANRYKHERDELLKKVRILLKENEKSTNLIQMLASQDEEQRDEFGSVQQLYQNQVNELQQITRDQAGEIQMMDQQLQQCHLTLQEYEMRIAQLSEENQQLQSTLEDSNDKKNVAFEEHISQLIQQNEELQEELMGKQRQLQIYQELEKKVDCVIAENEKYKDMNDKLHEQLRQHEELLFDHSSDSKRDDKEKQEKDKMIAQLQQRLKNTEIKLSVMSEDNIRLNRLIQGRKISEKLNL